MRALKILIIDQNQFFVYGLKQTINNHFNKKNISVKYIHSKRSYSTADVIILAQDQSTIITALGLISQSVVNTKLIRVISRQQSCLTENVDQWIFYRHQDHSALLSMIDKILKLSKQYGAINMPETYQNIETKSLTRRQHEIIYYILKGMNLIEIAHLLNINEKTVSHHKRAAMVRLQLKGTTELYHWAFGRITSPIFEEQ
nr:helix-turn-helix transcriptional regulator [uncultured Moellerella sp.]